MIYLDNSATTFPKPQCVVKAINESFFKYGANPGRSGHSFSLKTAIKIFEVREKLANFFGAESPENVIFSSGCTESLNLAILGTIQQGGHIICSVNDHNSVLRPVFHLAKQNLIEVDIAKPKGAKLTLDDILPLVKPNTYLICVNHISNVDGMEANLYEIGKFCFEKCILFLVDSAQSAGHKKINILKQHIDLLAFAGHKGLYGPMGVGGLITSSKVKLQPIKFGGTGTDSFNTEQPKHIPEGFESGTLPVPAIVGLGEGITFAKNNFETISNKFDDLTTYLNYELTNLEHIKVYTHPDNANGVLAFNIANIPSTTISNELDEYFGIMVRSGLHCAPLKHENLGTLEQGVVRISISYFTKFSDIAKLVKAVKVLIKKHNEEL